MLGMCMLYSLWIMGGGGGGGCKRVCVCVPFELNLNFLLPTNTGGFSSSLVIDLLFLCCILSF